MKKHISILSLLSRSSIYKICLLFAGTAALRTLSFSFWMESEFTAAMLFLAEMSLLTWILCRTGQNTSESHQSYTLQRLAVTQKALFFWQAGYNYLCYLMLWGFQLVVAYLLCRLLLEQNSQTLFLTFARSRYLHTLMPAYEVMAWIKNFTYLAAMAIHAACYPIYRNQHKKDGGHIIMLTSFMLIFYLNETGAFEKHLFAIIVALIYSIVGVYRIFRKEEMTDDALVH